MNRKLLNFILSGALLFGCVGLFSSCKDTDEDLLAEVKGDVESTKTNLQTQLDTAKGRIDTLEGLVESLRMDLDAHLKNHPTSGSGCTCNLTNINKQLNYIDSLLSVSRLDQIADSLATVPSTLINLESRLQQAETALNNLVGDSTLINLLPLLDYENLNTVIKEKYNAQTLPDVLTKILTDIATLQGKEIPADLTEKVDSLGRVISSIQSDLNLKADTTALKDAVNEINATLKHRADSLQSQVDLLVSDLGEKVDTITFNTLQITVKDLKQKVDSIEKANYQGQIDSINTTIAGLSKVYAKIDDLKSLENRLNNIINGIVIQQVTNKVFGSLMLPLGIQTNILMAYHGQNGSGIPEFPTARNIYEYDGGKVFDTKELTGVETFPVSTIILDESANNAGNVYFTVNPSNVDLTGSVFSLVNSLDYPCGIELSAPKASDKLLLYGWSRANNGFYCSNAYLSEANISKCSLSLGEDLKHEIATTAKDFLRDLRHQERPDISQIATTIKNLLQKLNGKVAANAIKGEYQYKNLEGKTVKASTYSNYGIAALTFQPQSFCFLEGQENKFDKLPEIPTIDKFEFDMGNINIDLKADFKVDTLGIKLQFNSIEIDTDDLTVTGEVLVDVVNVDENGQVVITQEPRKFTATADGIKDLVGKINTELEKIVGQVNDDVLGQVNEMINNINDQVNKMLEDMSANVNEQLNNLLDDLSSDVTGQLDNYINKINSLINKVNRLIARVNRVLANPNRYLQPMGIYTGADGDMHILSNSKVAPSKFKMNGGNATTLYYTSYTLETIAPAYKKFVKVVNAWKNGDTNRTNVPSVVETVNGKGSLNKVTNGDQLRFAFAPVAGYTYEIVFQAVDYQGYTSTRRCFIEVR